MKIQFLLDRKPQVALVWFLLACSHAHGQAPPVPDGGAATSAAAIDAKLESFRKRIADEQLQYTVGHTSALEKPIEKLATAVVPRKLSRADYPIAELAPKLSQVDALRFATIVKSNPRLPSKLLPTPCDSKAKYWDWRSVLASEPQVRDQKGCGACWDFGALGAFEFSHNIRNGERVDASEQYVLSCAGAGSCAEGWWGPVFDFLVKTGTTDESHSPYVEDDKAACPKNVQTSLRAFAWDFVDTSNISGIATEDSIKEKVCTHGPVVAGVMVDGPFQAYTGGIFSSGHAYEWVNHAVLIIGWDDSRGAWLIRNSWGQDWGENGGRGSSRGYMWIKYRTNNIGLAAAWVDAVRRFYDQDPSWQKLLEQNKVRIEAPLPPRDANLRRRLNVR